MWKQKPWRRRTDAFSAPKRGSRAGGMTAAWGKPRARGDALARPGAIATTARQPLPIPSVTARFTCLLVLAAPMYSRDVVTRRRGVFQP